MHLELFGLFERVLLLNGQIWLTGICLNFLLAETRYDFPIISRKASGDQAGCLLFIIRVRIHTVTNIIVSGKSAILVIKEGNQRPVTL